VGSLDQATRIDFQFAIFGPKIMLLDSNWLW